MITQKNKNLMEQAKKALGDTPEANEFLSIIQKEGRYIGTNCI